jgi:hypothetical protein
LACSTCRRISAIKGFQLRHEFALREAGARAFDDSYRAVYCIPSKRLSVDSEAVQQELLERLQRENKLLRELRRLELLEKYGPSAETLSDEQMELLELELGVSTSEVEADASGGNLHLSELSDWKRIGGLDLKELCHTDCYRMALYHKSATNPLRQCGDAA